MKTKTLKPTNKQLKIMREYWSILQNAIDIFYGTVGKLEREMSKEVGIKDMEFFQSDNEFVGIGNYDRTLKLIQRNELEDEK
jgi:hypothetical protein